MRVQKYAHKYNLFFTKVHRHLCGEKVFFLTKGPETTIHPYVKNTHTQKSSIKEKESIGIHKKKLKMSAFLKILLKEIKDNLGENICK